MQSCPGVTAVEAAVDDVLCLDPTAYAGGVGLWGATSPVYSTGPLRHEWGIHVHARDHPDAPKVLDETHERVDLVIGGEVIEIDGASATAVLVANVFNFPLKRLTCPHCGEAHLDREEFGTAAHKKHQCNRCGRAFYDPDGEPSISNPLAELRTSAPAAVPAVGRLDLRQADFSGGVAVWGSNAALLWTRTQPEVEGLHVHAWNEKGEIQIDDTFGAVTIDGFELDRRMVQVLMAQQSLSFLRGRVTSIDCPECGQPHFDDGATALVPHIDHMCAACGGVFRAPGRRRGVVSNPVRRQLDRMAASAPRSHGSTAA